jgi:hypothetical protein
MQVTVEIPDELTEQVKQRGETPEQFVESLVQSAIGLIPSQKSPKLTLDQMLDRLAINSDKIPQLPDEAFTRESFYPDHD